jgi:hypothetical protein
LFGNIAGGVGTVAATFAVGKAALAGGGALLAGQGLLAAGGAAVTAAALAIPALIVAGACILIKSFTDFYIKHFTDYYTSTIMAMPLLIKNKPMLAGVKGHKTLLPPGVGDYAVNSNMDGGANVWSSVPGNFESEKEFEADPYMGSFIQKYKAYESNMKSMLQYNSYGSGAIDLFTYIDGGAPGGWYDLGDGAGSIGFSGSFATPGPRSNVSGSLGMDDVFAAAGYTGTVGNSVTTLSGNSIEEKIWNYFIGKGFNDVQVAGILGNAKQESTLRPLALSGNKKYWTMFQLNTGLWGALDRQLRAAGLGKYVDNRGQAPDAKDLDKVLGIVLEYSYNQKPTGSDWVSKLKAASTVEEAAEVFAIFYEGCVGGKGGNDVIKYYKPRQGERFQEIDNRRVYARGFYNQYARR